MNEYQRSSLAEWYAERGSIPAEPGTFTPNLRALAEFYGRLASIPSVETLREGDRLVLLEDLAGLLWPQPTSKGSPQARKAAFQQAVRTNTELWQPILEEIHQQARSLLWELLDGKMVVTPPVPLPERPLVLSKDGILREGFKTQYVKDRLMMELLALLRPNQPFPFRRCPVCQTVFVPVKRQKFCSPNCTYKSTGARKKEEKRDYMRNYMADRRKRLKKARQKPKEK